MARWEAETNRLLNSEREELDGLEDFDYAKDLEEAWKNLKHDEFEGRRDLYFDDEGVPQLGLYQFEKDNPYVADTKSVHLSTAKALLASPTPSLTHVALMLEAAIQQNDLGEEGYEAWVLLGEVLGMDEKEESGLLALREAVRRAKLSGNGKLESELAGRALMSLAISYTNESFDHASQSTLRTWLRSRYDALIPPSIFGSNPTAGPWASHVQTTEAYLAVARQIHTAGKTDPDVQVGLGVLFYTNGEYDKAADCFQTALSARPDDYLLWNRLGSSLSNGAKPEEALNIYREALRLRPTYTRAIYNVGVACLNIGAHREAAEHFLTALALHRGADPAHKGGTRSEVLWQTLNRTFLAMDRTDLAALTSKGDVDAFRSHGFEF
jgi:peroxin-5